MMRNNRLSSWIGTAVFLLAAAQAHATLPIQHWQTTSGAQVYFVENRDLPMFDLSVEFPAGAGYDTSAKSGAASMTSQLLRLGAGGMNENEIARKLADVGAQLAPRFDTDRAGLALRTLSSAPERRQALDIFDRILQRPEFPEAVLEREKVRLIGALKEADTKPETIAALTFFRLAYGQHPYGLRSSGDVGTVSGLTRQDLVDFYRAHYVARRAVVAIIGDLSRDEAAAIAEEATARLPEPDTAAEPSVPPVADLTAGSVRYIENPASQSHILIGAPGIRRGDPDYFPLFVGNYVLGGGGFVSRLFRAVREDRGLAYSVASYFMPYAVRGPFVLGLQTERSQTEQALATAQQVLDRFVSQGPTEAELRAAKKAIAGGFALRTDSNRKILNEVAVIGFYRLPLDWLDRFVPSVEKLTAAQVRAAFAKRIDPKRLSGVIVGAPD